MQWLVKNSQVPTSIPELRQLLLENREITDEKAWFSPPHPQTFSLTELDINPEAVATALKLLESAHRRQDQIVIFGDYDADGITATAILWRVLHNLGFKVLPFIPNRLNHGYGLTIKALADIFATTPPQLIITVDNGIVAHEAVTYLNQKNCPLILTDHHAPEATLPTAQAIVHSTKLCGATVAWIFGREVIRHFGPDHDQLINRQLDLAGMATIADQMPLVDYNRAFATWGIKALTTSNRLGLLELIKATGINQTLIDANTINYGLAPRINAMGRLKHGLEALRLLCTTNLKQAQQLATELMATNLERQDLTAEQLETALQQVESQQTENLFVITSTDFHEGVIGLIAGRITEQFHKPTIVLSQDETTAKASARSIPGLDIVELIREVRTDLLAVGGHPMAAGFSVELTKIELVKQRLQQLARQFPPTLFEKTLSLECLLPPSLITEKTYHLVKTFEPFGAKNRAPIFGLIGYTITSVKTLGQDQEHLKLTVSGPTGQFLTVLAWKQGHLQNQLHPQTPIKIAGEISLNVWKGRTSVQIIAKSIEPET